MFAFRINADLVSGPGMARDVRSVGIGRTYRPLSRSFVGPWGTSPGGGIGLASPWAASPKAAVRLAGDWDTAGRTARPLILPFMAAPVGLRLFASAWSEAGRAGLALEADWQGSPRAAVAAAAAWADASPGGLGLAAPWIGSPRGQTMARAGWRDGQQARRPVVLPWGKGKALGKAVVLPWQKARRPGWGIDFVPPVDPGVGGGPDPHGTWRIYARVSYHMLHDISLVRLPDRLPIPASRLAFTASADSPHIMFSGTIHGRVALDAVMPSGGGAVELEASIDGITVKLVLDPPALNAAFGSNQITITGRSLSWYLGLPYQPPRDRTSTADATAQQLAADELPYEWSLSWVDDWDVPAGALSYRNLSPLQAVQRIAGAVGHVIVPSRTGKALAVRPRHPVMPWDYATTIPDLVLPASAALSLQKAFAPPIYANAVHVAGGAVGGVLGRVWRSGTAGDRLLRQVQDDLVTSSDAAYYRGKRELAGQWQQPIIRAVQLPLDGSQFPLAELGWLVRVDDAVDGAVFGAVAGVSWQAEIRRTAGGKAECRVTQSLSLGEDSNDMLAQFKALAPSDPLLYGTVAASHGDGTVTVEQPGGGLLRVRGDASVGAAVYVRAGRIDSPAPALTFYDLEA